MRTGGNRSRSFAVLRSVTDVGINLTQTLQTPAPASRSTARVTDWFGPLQSLSTNAQDQKPVSRPPHDEIFFLVTL